MSRRALPLCLILALTGCGSDEVYIPTETPPAQDLGMDGRSNGGAPGQTRDFKEVGKE